jgi:hypothetical protein
LTVDEASSTIYQKGTGSASASAVTPGEQVLVVGTTSATTITATQVIVPPTGSGRRLPRRGWSRSSAGVKVVGAE